VADRHSSRERRTTVRRASDSVRVELPWPLGAAAELYDAAPIAYVTMDGQGIVRSLNLRGAALLGAQPQRAVGLPFRTLVVRADRGALAAHVLQFRRDGHALTELRVQTFGGQEVPVKLESQRGGGSPDICWTSLYDISARKRTEVEHARLEAAEKTARDANLMKDRFIAVLSHELRAPLAPLLAAVGGLESAAASPEKLAKLGDMIRRNVLREARLIDDLLDVSRIASGKVALQRASVDVHAVARESLEMLAPEAVGRHQSLSIDLEAVRHQVDGDAARLRQVFTNLLKNAAKFTPEGGHIAVRSWNHGGRVIVEVADDGMGIEPAALSRIFERFEQADGSTAAGGLGLGLAICRGMIELHGGKISAHSAGLGHGARLLVELPATAAAVPAQPLQARRPARRAARGGEILVVEDEPDLAEALLEVLASEGYHARAVATAREALAADLEHVQVVISDLGLPDLDGRLLVERLKSKYHLKAIALSGYGTEADVLSSQAAGFDQHLTKPVEMDVLLGAIDRVCAT
jgi:two-component system CheB/CheR fusion protein